MCGALLPVKGGAAVPCETCLRQLPLLKEPLINAAPGIICLAPLKYTERVRSGIHGLKFHRRVISARYFARLMAECLKRYRLGGFDAVTWVPVSFARRRGRGYDQSELLAREIARLTGTKARGLILKVRNTRPNSRLKTEEERRLNVSGAFRLAPFAKSHGKLLLIDDVVTTGSTIAECAGLLTAGGAGEIVVLAVASAFRNEG
ncbi:MAG: ComF family protein [Oscillospiraceae bacterium]|nr:ComF family protein [Oscillospiraceae bacterium]